MTDSHTSLLQKIVFTIAGVLGATILYAMDWQREQDANISAVRELQREQKALYSQQKELNDSIYQFNVQLLQAVKAQQEMKYGEHGASTSNLSAER
jgi:hypothetical protein